MTGAYIVADEAYKIFKQQGLSGNIVLTTSANAVVAKKGSLAYDTSKAAANHLVRDATGLPVSAGPAEATIIGNVLVQSIAHGRFASLADARPYVGSSVQLKSFTPQVSAGYEEAQRRYAIIETRYVPQTV